MVLFYYYEPLLICGRVHIVCVEVKQARLGGGDGVECPNYIVHEGCRVFL